MTDRATLGCRVLLTGVLLVVSVLLTSCDFAAAGDTAILNAESVTPPTVRYIFTYTPADTTAEGDIEVVSEETDKLGSVLSENGFSRSDVESAQIDSVTIERLSAPTLGYLTGADVYLGTSTDGPRIATGEFRGDRETATLDVTTRTVTNLVQQGETTTVFARFDRNRSRSIPTPDRVQATVYFRLEVGGV